MSTPEPNTLEGAASDAELVTGCLAGDRDAFGRIVGRYQRLLCSLAYAATGNVAESEDAAQETFVTAWCSLRDLREPEKLRPWLCGILRHKIGRLRRRYGRDAVLGAESMEAAGELPAEDVPVADKAMHAEEQALLWRALERVPVLYREPLVLYYRENRSIEHVAGALDLTEDAVKQRLARGRKMLQEQALAFVEGALARTTPGRAFTVGVLAVLPALAPAPVKAAGVGAAAMAHGSALAKTTGLAALLAFVAGAVSAVMQLRIGLDQSRTPRERRAVVVTTAGCFFGSLAFLGVLWGLKEAALRWWEQRAVFAAICQVLVVGFVVLAPLGLVRLMAYFRRLRSDERRRHPELFAAERDRVGSRAGVYRSRATVFGVPLVHVRFSSPDVGEGPVVGWIAAGDRAYGLLFAWGGLAVAPVSVGAFAVGFLSVGAVSVGVIGLGTFGTGLLAVGGIAVGFKAYAWLSALGWFAARSGGFGIAHVAAEAPVAFARHANDAAAHALVTGASESRTEMLFFIVVALATLIPVTLYTRAVRKRLGPPSSGAPPRDG
jgi:RNA polymerase sigma factor (sigma-70 family)